MCGIFGYVGTITDAAGVVFESLRRLEYRGYDSWGVAVWAGGTLHLRRQIGKLGAAPTDLPPAGLALGHTRWATTGAVSEANAHPHRDCTGRLAIAHNGIVENHLTLREGLIARGHVFHSQTDTEVIAHLLEEALADAPSGPAQLVRALCCVSQQLSGRNAMAALDSLAGQLAAVTSGSSLVVGIGDGAHYLASDEVALLAHTQRLIHLRDGHAVSLQADAMHIVEAATGLAIPLQVEEVHWQPEETELNGARHFLEKEIAEQPAVLRQIAAEGGDQAAALTSFLQGGRHLYLIACGTAFHAALCACYLLAQEAGRAATTVYAHEFAAFTTLVGPEDAVVALSQSGETIDVLDAVRMARMRGARVAALVNVPRSTLTREVDLAVLLNAGPERSVLSTKTFTAKLAYLWLVAGALRSTAQSATGPLWAAAAEIERLHTEESLAEVRRVAGALVAHDHLFVLGRGLGYPLALEAALKIKEVTYLHTEGFPAGELKHGVIALIEPGTPVLILLPQGADEAHLLTAAGEVKARGAFVVGIGPRSDHVLDMHLPVRAPGPAYFLAVSAAIQRLAYEMALLRGTDPDRPRNLAKSVTVR